MRDESFLVRGPIDDDEDRFLTIWRATAVVSEDDDEYDDEERSVSRESVSL